MSYRQAAVAAFAALLTWASPAVAQNAEPQPSGASTQTSMQESSRGNGLMMEAMGAMLVAMLSGGAGLYFGMRKKRSEAAFDRQLQWCERAVAAFHEAGAAISAAEHARAVDAVVEANCWSAVTDTYQKLIPIAGQRVLYATPEGDRAISEFMTSLESLIASRTDSGTAETEGHADVCMDRLRRAWLSMSVEARKHLALDPLDSSAHQRFTRSFEVLRTRSAT